MQLYTNNKVLFVVGILVLLLITLVLIEGLIIKFNGKPVPRPDIPRGKQSVGSGPLLTYVILGDSTSISQGGDYAQGYAVQSALHLAQKHTVTYQNFGVSGARVHDVLHEQLPKALTAKPDVVLVGIGANDVTHLTSLKAIELDMDSLIDQLRAVNPNVRIIITGAPQMGSVPRFPQPAKWLAKQRTAQVNTVLDQVARHKKIMFARIADKTGKTFEQNPQLFAQDKFHPTTEGYALWTQVITEAL